VVVGEVAPSELLKWTLILGPGVKLENGCSL
jgi:hypothetical protein